MKNVLKENGKIMSEEKITLMPLFKRVIVETEEVNPHRKQTTDSGLIIPDNKIITSLVDKEQEGIVDGGEQRIKYAVVQAVADDCIKVKVGDKVVIDDFAAMPVAMGIPSLRILNEGAILYIIKENG